ncbi:MAG: hypothetical protein IBX57_00800 [Gammaproteobacteria bacterium]|nr:hypothetical protein [Gammaproteobacteria bacterium]
MKKLLMVLAIVPALFLAAGCSTTVEAIKYGANNVCTTTPEKRAVLREEVDKATQPHVVRVQCYANE